MADLTKDQKLHPGTCTCPACSPDLWAAGIKGSKTPGECNEGLDQSRGRASNAGLGSSPPIEARTSNPRLVERLRSPLGNFEHPHEANQRRAQSLCTEAAAEIERLERELWVIAECIFQNVSSDDAKHWARGIKVSMQSGDVAPRVTVETKARLASDIRCRHAKYLTEPCIACEQLSSEGGERIVLLGEDGVLTRLTMLPEEPSCICEHGHNGPPLLRRQLLPWEHEFACPRYRVPEKASDDPWTEERKNCTCPKPGTSNSQIDPMCPISFPHPWARPENGSEQHSGEPRET